MESRECENRDGKKERLKSYNRLKWLLSARATYLYNLIKNFIKSSNRSVKKFDYRHIPLKVPNVEFNFDIRFLTFMRRGNVKMLKLGSFVREETYTILT